MDDAGIPALVEAIKRMHGCDATWVESLSVRETFQDQVVWDGEVQVFNLVGHPSATRAYAWSATTEGAKRRFHAVLDAGPVRSAVDAVRAAIAVDAQAKRN